MREHPGVRDTMEVIMSEIDYKAWAWLYNDKKSDNDKDDELDQAWGQYVKQNGVNVNDLNKIIASADRPRRGRSGYLYDLHLSVANGEYKIGIARNVANRVQNYRTHVPPSISIIVDFEGYSSNVSRLEQDVFELLYDSR